jgi:hypothetical protein
MKAKALIRILERFDPEEEVVLEVTVRLGVMEPGTPPTRSDQPPFNGVDLTEDWRETAIVLRSSAVLHDRLLV